MRRTHLIRIPVNERQLNFRSSKPWWNRGHQYSRAGIAAIVYSGYLQDPRPAVGVNRLHAYPQVFSYTTQHCIKRHQARLFNYEGVFLVCLVANGVVREFLLHRGKLSSSADLEP